MNEFVVNPVAPETTVPVSRLMNQIEYVTPGPWLCHVTVGLAVLAFGTENPVGGVGGASGTPTSKSYGALHADWPAALCALTQIRCIPGDSGEPGVKFGFTSPVAFEITALSASRMK